MKGGDETWPGVSTSLLMTLCSVAAVYFWWVLVAPLGSNVLSLIVGMAAGRGAVALLAAQRLPSPRAPRLGLRLPKAAHLPWLLLLAPSAFLVLELQNALFASVGARPLSGALEVTPVVLGIDRSGWLLPAAIALVLVTPLATEFLFRGVMQPGLVRRHGRWKGILLAALFSSAAHVAITAFASPLGGLVAVAVLPWQVLLGWLRETTGSFLASALVRALSSAALLVVLSIPSRHPVAGITATGVHLPVGLLAASVVSVVLGVLLLRRAASATERG